MNRRKYCHACCCCYCSKCDCVCECVYSIAICGEMQTVKMGEVRLESECEKQNKMHPPIPPPTHLVDTKKSIQTINYKLLYSTRIYNIKFDNIPCDYQYQHNY